VKVTPSQQLILASEAGPRSSSDSVLEALGLSAAGAVVKRMTVVASRPDATLVLLLPASFASTQVVARSRAAPSSSYLRPAELYARAQASFGVALKGVHIDVLA
jgi:hypothetical protein